MLITENYRQLNKELHESRKDYGVGGHLAAAMVMDACQALNTRSVLDYGCGKSTLSAALPFIIQEYDPAIEKHSKTPDPADIVVCMDVLEHIEPECLDAVLDDLKRVTKKYGIFTIATRPAVKTLADGRNAHLIVEPAKWWMLKIFDRFEVDRFNVNDGGFLVIVRAHE